MEGQETVCVCVCATITRSTLVWGDDDADDWSNGIRLGEHPEQPVYGLWCIYSEFKSRWLFRGDFVAVVLVCSVHLVDLRE